MDETVSNNNTQVKHCGSRGKNRGRKLGKEEWLGCPAGVQVCKGIKEKGRVMPAGSYFPHDLGTESATVRPPSHPQTAIA